MRQDLPCDLTQQAAENNDALCSLPPHQGVRVAPKVIPLALDMLLSLNNNQYIRVPLPLSGLKPGHAGQNPKSPLTAKAFS